MLNEEESREMINNLNKRVEKANTKAKITNWKIENESKKLWRRF